MQHQELILFSFLQTRSQHFSLVMASKRTLKGSPPEWKEARMKPKRGWKIFRLQLYRKILCHKKKWWWIKQNRTKDRREALRIKLWDILGTVSSQNKQVSQDPEVGVNNLNPEQNIDKKSKPFVKSRQNSDTIEADFESPDQTIRRPVTRSLTMKRAPSKVQTNKTRNAPSSTYTRKHPEKNIFSFEERFSGRLDAAVTNSSPKSYRKKRERKGLKVETHRICFPAKNSADEVEQVTVLNKTIKCAEKTSSLRNIVGSFHIDPPRSNSEFVELENGIRKKGSLQLSAMKMSDELGNVKTSTSPKHKDQQEDLTNSFTKNILDPHVDLQSPRYQFRTATKSFSPSSLPKNNLGELDDQSPGHCSFSSLLASKPDYYKADVGTESSDNAEELEDSPLIKSDPYMEENDAENRLSESSEERDSKSSKEGSPIDEGRGTESLSPEFATAGKPKFVLFPSQRLRSQEDINPNGFSPISAPPKGTEESNGLQSLYRPSGHNEEDELANAITLIALALERVKSKIKLVTSKKSAEVLMSVAEGIYLQLQNAESHIQKDVVKLTSLRKSKRKRLETEFGEQQEQLKLVYRKFEAELNRHLQECRSTVAGMEEHEREFRGFLEKQKTSQRKLLKQVEEAIETQLDDSERRITAVHKLAREKMLHLKNAVAECLKEGILS
ncbi:Transmembrane protein like [Actinidia chinensis var. chinensis]|uniref:Transmembrane protein like n=1 Tax=Actinidia chinensis var. chinensis TaxID=1590841 RepID=A0A2R6PNQ2_ACTCC|nr:Transmembrane protein like [Actinidia chinensis var. chinensis]